MHSDDAMELRVTWKEAQDLFRPPPDMEPIVSVVEDLEVEEYVVSNTYYTFCLLR